MPTTDHANITGTHLHVQGPVAYRAVNTTPITVVVTDGLIVVDASGGAAAVNLLAANAVPIGFWVLVKKSDSSVNLVTITAAGVDLIEGVASQTLGTQYQWTRLVSNGVDTWWRFF